MLKCFVPTLAGLVTAATFACPALAVPRTFVSGAGNDANACDTPAAPCRTFVGAYAKTDTDGEISVVASGDFGSLIITKSIAITNDGAGAAMVKTPTLDNGFTINGAGIVVTLRGLDIDGAGNLATPASGIRVLSGSEVHVQNCTIRNFNGVSSGGIRAERGGTKLFVSDTNVQYNGTSTTGGGIVVVPSGVGGAIAVLTRVTSEGNSTAFKADSSGATGFVSMMIRDSSASGGTQHGVWAVGGGGGVDVFVSHSTIGSNGGSGLRAGPRRGCSTIIRPSPTTASA